MQDQQKTKNIKVGATVLVFVAIALQIWHLLASLPSFLSTVFVITGVILIIHAVEGVIGAFLILLYKTRVKDDVAAVTSDMLVSHLPERLIPAVIKAGLYVFFVGTVGLVEIIKETKRDPVNG